MRYLFFFLLFAPFFFGFTNNSRAFTQSNQRVTRVAVIDTGLDLQDPRFKDKLCAAGAQDFTGEGITDIQGHGTHVAGLISKYAKTSNYCLIILKYYSEKASTSQTNNSYIEALDSLSFFKPDVVNISTSGPMEIPGEREAISNLPNVRFFVAAGNNAEDLNKVCDVFPACLGGALRNITVVGNKNAKASNYGDVVDLWINGNNVESTFPYSLSPTGKAVLSGTSMSTAIASGRYVYELR